MQVNTFNIPYETNSFMHCKRRRTNRRLARAFADPSHLFSERRTKRRGQKEFLKKFLQTILFIQHYEERALSLCPKMF